jgi:putative phage-type endonuclease
MLQYYNHLDQGSEEWKDVRSKIVTSTDAAKATGKSTYATPEQWFDTKINGSTETLTECMARGSYFEIQPANIYIRYNPHHKYYTTGICIDTETYMGYSPDLMVNDDGLVEIKCPRWGYRNAPTPEHICQMQHALGISGRKWCDYVQWHASKPDDIKIIRVYADQLFWEKQLSTCMEWHQAIMDHQSLLPINNKS